MSQTTLDNEHRFLKPETYLRLALAQLQHDFVLPRIFSTFPGERFKSGPSRQEGGELGQVLNYTTSRFAGPSQDYEWRTRLNPIQLTRVSTTSVPITLNQHIVHGIGVTNEQLTLDVENAREDFIIPQTVEVRRRFEDKVRRALETAPFKVSNANADAQAADPYKYALSLRKVLNQQGVPSSGRYLLVGDDVESWLLESDRLSRLSETGSTEALRQATLGMLAGFTVVRTSLIAPDAVYAVHGSAIMISNLAPELPMGLDYKARETFGGVSMLLTRDYDPSFQQSRSVLSTFMGTNSVNDEIVTYTRAEAEADTTGAIIAGAPKFDGDGNPQTTGNNVRGVKGVLTNL